MTWQSKKLSVVVRINSKAEFHAMRQGMSEEIWFKWMLKKLKIENLRKTSLLYENKDSIEMPLTQFIMVT